MQCRTHLAVCLLIAGALSLTLLALLPPGPLTTWLWQGARSLVLAWALLAACAASSVLLGRGYGAAGRRAAGADAAPLDRAGVISRATFWWVMPTLKLAHMQGKLEADDLPDLADADEPGRLHRRFDKRCQSARLGAQDWWQLITTALFHTQRAVFLQSFLLGWLFLLLMFLDPIILQALLDAVSVPASPGGLAAPLGLGYKFTLVGVLSASMLVRVTCMELCYFTSVRACNNARSTLVLALFASSLDSAHLSAQDTGRLTNLMATGHDRCMRDEPCLRVMSKRRARTSPLTRVCVPSPSDVDKFAKCEWLVWFFAMFTFALLSLPAVVYMLYALMGSAAIVGFATLLVTYSSSAMMGSLIRPVVQRLQQRRDERGQLLSVLLQCMRLIKIQGSQPAMKCQLGAAREREMRELKFQRYLTAGNTLLGALLSLSVPVSMFSWYTLVQGQILSPATAFTALAWISQLRWSINALPGIYTVAATIRPSAQRLAQTLFEVRGTGASAGRGVDTSRREETTSPEVAVAMADGTVCLPSLLGSGTHASLESGQGGEGAPSARYEGMERAGEEEVGLLEGAVAEEVMVLDRISLEIRRGQLVVICGEVGAGKSTLLAALARARPLASGRLRVSGSRAYAGQKAFIMTGSVRDNILFQLPWEPDRYADVLARAQLLPDLALLAQGDLTLVGSEGVQLSGGQRARVALARVLYADADVLFFDDVMSALDAHTGAAVWRDALCWCKARGKTVVLATHQLHLLQRPEVDAVALVHQGRLVSFGPYAELMASSSSSCALLSQCRRDHEDGAMREAHDGGGGDAEVHQPCISGSGEDVGRLAAAKDAAGGASNVSNVVSSDSSGETLSAQSSPADDAEHETGGMRMETMVRLLRAALRQLQGQRIDQAVIDRACDALIGSCGDMTGGGGQTQGEIDERKKEGLISREDFMVYLHEFGTRAALVALAAVTIASALFSVGSNVFLAYWTDGNSRCAPAAGNSTLEEFNSLVPSYHDWPAASTSTLPHHVLFVMRAAPVVVAGWVGAGGDGGEDRCEAEQQQRNLGMYAVLGALGALLTCSQAVVLTPCALRASRGLHARLVDALLAAPMSFFDATSAGAIMNRFLQDMANIDNFVPNAVMDLCAKSLDILTQIALVTFMAPSSLLIVPLLVPAYVAIYQRVRIGARDSKRIEAVAHTPVYSFFADLLRGRDTVAAFGEHHQRLFARANESRVRRLARATIGTQSLCELAPPRTLKEQAVC